MINENRSEVARIRQKIAEELEAMQRGFHHFAAGVARHDFIHTRMEQIGGHQEELAVYIGQHNAVNLVCELYIDKISGNQGG